MELFCLLGIVVVAFFFVSLFFMPEPVYGLPVDKFYEGDTVEFIENMSESQKTIGLRGTVVKRWLDSLGWVHITVELSNGNQHTLYWVNIKAVKKVIEKGGT